ncbi:bifunctional oligoribonuclease/PAP phosphatase NrnA [Fructilactobacillus vespulae]|uniref:DHH family phosphoesterase n=1 Tax=Fructilactobacillus vespulae TaxID=1249630 RepID=UPI0039B50F2C
MTIQKQILAKIGEYETVIIHRHQHPDPDAIGSQMGLADLIKTTFPNKNVLCVGKQYESFKWLGETDEVSDDQYQNALVIVVDTANQPRVDDDRFHNGKELIKIDHHPNDDEFGDLMWVNPDASSVSEMIYDLFKADSDNQISDNGARVLYAGIVGDTGRFKYPSTTSHTFEVASGLTKFNFSLTDIAQKEDEIDIPLARLAAYVYQNLTISETGAAHIILTNEVIQSLDLGDDSTASVVPLPGNIGEVTDWAIFVQQKDESYRIRLRSKGPSINEIAKLHNGGGHALASGAIAADDAEIKQVIKELDQLNTEYLKKGAE